MAIKELSYKQSDFRIAYEICNPKAQKDLVILHGWGSNKEIMKQAFGKRLQDYRHIYIDMPGFGASSNELVLTTDDYAKIIALFLELIEAKPFIAMGHSFGGKVAALLDAPWLVLLSSAGVLTKKPWSVRLKIATVKFLKPLGFKAIRELFKSGDVQGMSHAMYETFKNVVDEDFEQRYSAIKSSALLYWGIDDTATPLYTGEKIASLISRSHFLPLEGDHFFFLPHAQRIAEDIEQRVTKGI